MATPPAAEPCSKLDLFGMLILPGAVALSPFRLNRLLDTLRARTSEICRKLPEQDSGRANCEKFLAAKARPTQAA